MGVEEWKGKSLEESASLKANEGVTARHEATTTMGHSAHSDTDMDSRFQRWGRDRTCVSQAGRHICTTHVTAQHGSLSASACSLSK